LALTIPRSRFSLGASVLPQKLNRLVSTAGDKILGKLGFNSTAGAIAAAYEVEEGSPGSSQSSTLVHPGLPEHSSSARAGAGRAAAKVHPVPVSALVGRSNQALLAEEAVHPRSIEVEAATSRPTSARVDGATPAPTSFRCVYYPSSPARRSMPYLNSSIAAWMRVLSLPQ
jgi:hypothetical protein